MYYLGLLAFFGASWFSFKLGEMVGRNAERIDQIRRREWQHRLNQERNK